MGANYFSQILLDHYVSDCPTLGAIFYGLQTHTFIKSPIFFQSQTISVDVQSWR